MGITLDTDVMSTYLIKLVLDYLLGPLQTPQKLECPEILRNEVTYGKPIGSGVNAYVYTCMILSEGDNKVYVAKDAKRGGISSEEVDMHWILTRSAPGLVINMKCKVREDKFVTSIIMEKAKLALSEACLHDLESKFAQITAFSRNVLELLHKKHEIVHGDIKADNILLVDDSDNGLRISDFGSSKKKSKAQKIPHEFVYHTADTQSGSGVLNEQDDVCGIVLVLLEIILRITKNDEEATVDIVRRQHDTGMYYAVVDIEKCRQDLEHTQEHLTCYQDMGLKLLTYLEELHSLNGRVDCAQFCVFLQEQCNALELQRSSKKRKHGGWTSKEKRRKA